MFFDLLVFYLQPSETDYEGVYWYPEETTTEVGRRDTDSRSRSLEYGGGPASTEVGSDAYVEIPGTTEMIF